MTLSAIGLTDSHIMVGDSSNVGTDVAMSGDVTIDNTGQTTIAADVDLAGNPTTTTQSPGDDSARIATTAYVDAAVASGASPPTFQYLTSGSSATYTRPAGCKAIHVEMVGGGGGGGAATTNNGSNGTDTIFNGVHAKGGTGGAKGGSSAGLGGAGGTGGSGTASLRLPGGAGQTARVDGTGGGSSCLGGAGGGTLTSGGNAGANTGSGGGGGASGSSSTEGGGGGGAGEYVVIDISGPSSTYTYTVPAGGAGGTAGVQAGGNGGSGLIIVTEYY